MANKYELEQVFQVWDNEAGTCIEIGPSRDLGDPLLEIRRRDASTEVVESVSFDRGEAPYILKALMQLIDTTTE